MSYQPITGNTNLEIDVPPLDQKKVEPPSKEFNVVTAFYDFFGMKRSPEKKDETDKVAAVDTKKENKTTEQSKSTKEEKPATQTSVESVSPLLAQERAKVRAAITTWVAKGEEKYQSFIMQARASDSVFPDSSIKDRNGIAVPREIFDDMMTFRKSVEAERINRIIDLNRVTEINGKIVGQDREWIKYQTEQVHVELNNRMLAYVKQKHIERGGASEEILNKELHNAFNLTNQATPSRGGMFDAITQQFYDPLKGGLQLGGIVGIILGFLAGSALVPEGMGWMGMLAKVLMIGAFVYAGNKTVDYINTKNEFAPDKNVVAKSKEVTTPQPEQKIEKKADEPKQDQGQEQKTKSGFINPSILDTVGRINMSGGETVSASKSLVTPVNLAASDKANGNVINNRRI